MPQWQDHLFIALSRSANDATDYFRDSDRPGRRGGDPSHDLSHDPNGMHFGMAMTQNQAMLCFKRRAISRVALPLCSEAFFEASAFMMSNVAAPAAETTAANGHGNAHSTAGFKALMLGSIGVVYGDIGTSPLYALREAVIAASGQEARRQSAVRARRVVADPVGADHRGDAEIRARPAPRRQPWRRADTGTDGARAARRELWRRAIVLLGMVAAPCFTATR